MAQQILEGIRVLELGQLIAGPFAAKTLADFGAHIIKVEPPGQGDPLRKWRMLHEGTSVWWEAQSRNKESVCIDLRQPEGQALVRKLAAEADVLIENFRPGTMEKWGLGWDVLHADNPRLIMLRVSGYGQTGPKKDEPGFAAVAEAMAGLRHLTGEPGRAPVRAGLSLGDTIAGLHGAMGVLLALYQRDARGGEGQVIDVALYESLFNLSESLLPEYSAFGAVRQPAGGALPGIAPSNAYPCASGEYVLVAANGDAIFKRMMLAIGRADLADDPALERNDGRVARVDEIDAAIADWTRTQTVESALAVLRDAQVPSGRIYTVKDIAEDPHYRARGVIESVTSAGGLTVEVPGVVPKLSASPGAIHDRAPALGEHTDAVLRQAGFDDAAIADLRARKVIA
ncbi:putative caiB/baiF CoA-transferase family protein [Cupriavidus taiwanensis]|uniref:CaiB/baiF CoA-transferase family protein n=1 Tax=Cupriavidus taiwanensis TaxID=164546 RepID=A0A375DZ77_9BURK|nr:CaiB/BaiF CoA-transferase family protein [Cupriavidus taiwanensis]SOZ52719.1 putative caiB/baiF CoA-transferase family protein [Cupriavidus taiwanensis]SOZ54233.1 putative caiB/baiF CoA-transferase family protein [Cupriavidus taiwanensis]SOZ56600.1 putative caiB/baiF CoA-transferase family protein [Cupriavidus taiwanensis]SPA04881.1 putative caiB/baiF CoA-transferase family protein [Cupriavidus taiwanensis]SPA16443.1 putative caiB/baiF CoA-transferase family protein [Cupriavidus taiwanensis